MHNKPTGRTGFTRVTINPNQITFKQLNLPKTKEKQEEYFVKRFVEESRKQFKFIINNYQQNKENDFDYLLEIGNHEKIYLELKEVLFQEDKNSLPYKHKNLIINNYDYAQSISKSIKNYSQKYSSDKPLHLLLYNTDFKFSLSNITMDLLRYFLHDQHLIFENIFYYSPLDQENGIVNIIFPSSREWDNFDANNYKNSIEYKFDQEKFKPIQSEGVS